MERSLERGKTAGIAGLAPAQRLLCLLAASCVAAPAGRDAQLDAYLREEMSRRQIPGLSVLVLKDRRVVFERQYGLASLAPEVPVTADTTFEIASMTKAFTAAAVLLLEEQGRLAVTDPLATTFPELPEAWRDITLEHLMNHSAGLRDDWDEGDAYFLSRSTDAAYLESLLATPLRFAPGTDWSYGCGPFVLGLVIERVSGASYAQFLRRSILEPLGMAATDVNDGAVGVPGRAVGYVMRDGVLQEGVRLPPAAHARADVGIRTTARDLARWSLALEQGSLLSAESRARMFTPGRLADGQPIAYGLGWFVTPYRGHTEISHGGGFRTGFHSFLGRYPEDGLTVVLLTNRFGAGVSTMARAVAAYYERDFRPISTMPPRPERDSARTAIVARVLEALAEGRPCVDLLPGVGRLGGWSRSELREALSGASAPTFVDDQDLSGQHASAFGTPLLRNGFYRTDGDRPRYWTVGFTADDRVAYLELEE